MVVLGGGGAFAFLHGSAPKDSAAAPASPPAPIVAGTVAQHDVPIYLTGVGTVIAYNTVVIRAQILGQIVSINFTEGQARVPTRPRSTSTPPRAIAIRRSL
jgi:membrane fusion protein, multidrug efflux system